ISASKPHLELDLISPAKSACVPKVSLAVPQGNEIADVPEQYRTREDSQKALVASKNSEARLRKIIDTIPTLAWCNLPDGSNEFLNQRWHDYTGLGPEESGGSGWQAVIHPQDLPRMMEEWQELLSSGEAGEVEAPLRRHDGPFS